MTNNGEKRKKPKEDILTVKRSTKRVETQTTLNRKQAQQLQQVATFGDLDAEATKALPHTKVLPPQPIKEVKQQKQFQPEKEVKKEKLEVMPPNRNSAAPKNKKLQAAEQVLLAFSFHYI